MCTKLAEGSLFLSVTNFMERLSLNDRQTPPPRKDIRVSYLCKVVICVFVSLILVSMFMKGDIQKVASSLEFR